MWVFYNEINMLVFKQGENWTRKEQEFSSALSASQIYKENKCVFEYVVPY